MMRRDLNSTQQGRKPKLLSVLDIGSSKIVCLIARLRPLGGTLVRRDALPSRNHGIEVLGFGMQKSRGIKAGQVVDMQAVEQSIRLAVDAAERMCGLVVDSILVNFSSRQQKSHHIEAQVPIDGKVSRRDVRRVLARASTTAFNLDRSILHALPVSFRLDGDGKIEDPLDMAGELLKLDMHVVSVDGAAVRNLEQSINRAHLGVEAIVATSLASSLAVFVGDEAKLGACCIDIGADTTNLSIFDEGKFVHGETLALGGHHITLDIARLLSLSVEEAERLKVLHGSALDIGDDDRVVQSSTGRHSPVLLSRIIRARVEEIFEILQGRIERCGLMSGAIRRFVLTGGGAGLTGIGQVAGRLLAAPVRTGRPLGLSGLPEVARGSAFSVAAGLLIYPQFYGFDGLKMGSTAAIPQGVDVGEDRSVLAPLARARRWFGNAMARS